MLGSLLRIECSGLCSHSKSRWTNARSTSGSFSIFICKVSPIVCASFKGKSSGSSISTFFFHEGRKTADMFRWSGKCSWLKVIELVHHNTNMSKKNCKESKQKTFNDWPQQNREHQKCMPGQYQFALLEDVLEQDMSISSAFQEGQTVLLVKLH